MPDSTLKIFAAAPLMLTHALRLAFRVELRVRTSSVALATKNVRLHAALVAMP